MKNYQRKQFWQAHNYRKNLAAVTKQNEMLGLVSVEAAKFLKTGLLVDQRNVNKQ
jgi:hypothetical protein